MGKKKDKDKTRDNSSDLLVAVVLDKSGSMESCRAATVSGFNEFKADQRRQGKKLGSATLVSLTLFDTAVELRHVAVPIGDVSDLDVATYVPGGCTALYDAIGSSIRAVEQAQGAGSTALPAKVLFVIQTDGYENSSREWNQKTVFDLIARKKADGWAFMYLGADQDAFAAGAQMGVSRDSTLSYASSDTRQTYGIASNSATQYRTGARSADNLVKSRP